MNYINIIDSLIVHKSGTKITITNSKGNHSWSMINYNSSLTWNNLGLPLTNHDSSAVTIICPDEWAFKWEDHRIFQQAKWLRYQVLKNIRACQNLSLTKKHDRFVHVFRVWLGYIYRENQVRIGRQKMEMCMTKTQRSLCLPINNLWRKGTAGDAVNLKNGWNISCL
jgi:hypothetical protein